MSANTVLLYVYDLSGGMATTISPLLIGKKIDGIWHTSIVVYEREYFFGSSGVETCVPGTTALREPLKKIKLGETQLPYSVFTDYLSGLAHSTFKGSTYNILNHNCNHFTEELAQFLCGTSIPKHILDLPNEVLSTSLGPAIPALIQQLERSARPLDESQDINRSARPKEQSPDFEHLNSQIEEARSDSEKKEHL